MAEVWTNQYGTGSFGSLDKFLDLLKHPVSQGPSQILMTRSDYILYKVVLPASPPGPHWTALAEEWGYDLVDPMVQRIKTGRRRRERRRKQKDRKRKKGIRR